MHVKWLEGGYFIIGTLDANLYVEGTDLEHGSSIRIGHLESPWHVDILGTLTGHMILGVST
jgi:hypothetical protein